jgi:hypothetical protein
VIPLIAMQMNAMKIGASVSLVFSTVLDQVRLGLVDEDEEVQEVTDRGYWEQRGTKETIAMADEIRLLRRCLREQFGTAGQFFW